jgi:pilus assembly protein Flp/PilA
MPCRSIVMCILKDETGASAMEYGLIIAMISIALITSMQSLALGVNSVWSTATSGTSAVFGTSA